MALVEPMKICDLTQFYSPVSGGVRRYVEQKVEHLRRHSPGDEHILVIPGAVTRMTGDATARVYEIASPLVSRTSRYRVLLSLHLVEEILEKERPDIIESGDPYQVAWKSVASGRALGIPVIGFYHSHFPEAYIRSVARYFGRLSVQIAQDVSMRYVRNLYNQFERTLVPSPALAKLLRDWGVERVENIDLGVDVDIFRPSGAGDEGVRAEFGVPADRTLLLYVGRLAAEKNVRTLFEAFEILSSREPGAFHLFAVGDGSLRGALNRLIEQTGAVSWLPFCGDAARLASIYRAADLFVHPSVNETFGLVALESQASGTPVVGIRGSYMDRIIFNDQLRWADENTPEALADAIGEMRGHDLRAEGLAASDTVRGRYSWKAVFGKLFSIYRQVIADYNR